MDKEPYAKKDKDLLSVDEVAEYLGVGPVTVYRWCRERRLRCMKLGKHWRIRREALEEFLERHERPLGLSEEARSLLDTLPAHTAIIDEEGTIVAVNAAWRGFAEPNGAVVSEVAEGTNYLKVCDSARGEQAEYAAAFARGIRSVFSGRLEAFEMEYPCHSPTERRWFVGRVVPFTNGRHRRAIVIHENVTERKRMEEQVERLADGLRFGSTEPDEPADR